MVAAIPIALAVVGTVVSAYGAQQAGKAQQAAYNQQAQIAQINAGQDLAASQRQAAETKRQTTLTEERDQAVAAGSGAGGTDPTVTTIQSNVAGRGLYNALNQLYSGEEAARGQQNEAGADIFAGENAAQAGRIKAFSTIVSGGTSLYSQYGPNLNSGMPTDVLDQATAGTGPGRL